MMHIVVCVKAVPGSTEVRMDPVTHTIVRDGGAAVVNPFDAAALEVALRIKEVLAAEGSGCRVSVLSMGIPATEALLRDCIARGADDALLLSDRAFAGADTLATSYALACGMRELGVGADAAAPDGAAALDAANDGCGTGGAAREPWLIICGKMAVDGDTAQIGPELAGLFDVPCVTDVRSLMAENLSPGQKLSPERENLSPGQKLSPERMRVRHGVDEGIETVEVPLPAVITVAKDIFQPRMPSIAGVLAAQDAVVRVRGAADVGADTARTGLAGSPTQVVRSFVPERSSECELLAGTLEQQAARVAELWGGGAR